METFPVFVNLPYPDGSPLEIFANGKGTFTIHEDKVNLGEHPNGCDPYIEVEIRSLLVDLKPGQQYAFQVRWHCCAADGGPIARVNRSAAIKEPHMAKFRDINVRVKGLLGLFRTGILEIVPIHQSGKTGHVRVVGPAAPLSARSIDVPLPFES